MQSSQGPPSPPLPRSERITFHTALLHLNPLPNAICHSLSPARSLPLASRYANSYQMEEEEVMMVAAGGDYSDLMKKMDITACTVIVPKVSDSDKQYFRTGFSRLLDPDPGS